MKIIKGYLRKLDAFGVSYSFKYKSQEKYSTSLGGFITLLFTALALFFGIYNFIPFYNRKNFTTIYYILKLAQTEQVYFEKSKVVFSVGLNCVVGNDGTKAEDLFNVTHKFNYYDVQDGQYVKKVEIIGTHPCTHTDFYNEFNKTFDDSQVYNYQCLDDLSRPMEGIFTSPVFSYYQFNVDARNNSQKLLNKIESYLIEKDCKFQIYYIDKTIDIDDYQNPIKSYLETVFIQLNPALSIRRNMYFMNQHLYDDDSFIWLFNDQNEEQDQISSLYSRYEEYSLYQGLNRTNASSDYLNWIKVFFRADTRKTDVKRKYQKIMEFYADASSLLVGLYEILLILFSYINTFYAELSLSKKIFFFKDLNDNHLDVNKHSEKISQLFSLSNPYSKTYKFNTSIQDEFCSLKEQKNSNKKDQDINEIKIYKNKKDKIPIKKLHSSKKVLTFIEDKKSRIKSENDEKSDNKLQLQLQLQNNQPYYSNYINIIHKRNNKRSFYLNKKEKIKQLKEIKYEFNVLEIIIVSFFKCCLTKNLNIKNNLNEKSILVLNNHLDIVSYVRNQMLFDIVNNTILDKNVKDIINFLCRPIISINNEIKNAYSDFYRSYKEDDFIEFSEELMNLIQKPDKKNKEKKLISLSNRHLKDLLVDNC